MDGVVLPVSLVVYLSPGGGVLASLSTINRWDWAHPAWLVCNRPSLIWFATVVSRCLPASTAVFQLGRIVLRLADTR